MSLKNLFDKPSFNVRKVRWMEFVSEFDFEIKHVTVKENKVSYALSEKINVASLRTCESDLRTRFLEAQNKDETYLHVKEKLQQGK